MNPPNLCIDIGNSFYKIAFVKQYKDKIIEKIISPNYDLETLKKKYNTIKFKKL